MISVRPRSHPLVLSLALLLAASASAQAGLGNALLPTFPNGHASVAVLQVPGVINRTGMATIFFCSSLANSAVDIGVEVFDSAGVLQNSVNGGVGTALQIAPGATATFSTSATAAFLETSIIPVSPVFSQGSARVVASSPSVRCTAMLVDDGSSPPASLATLGEGVAPGAGAQPAGVALPTFNDTKVATHAVLFPGAVKRGPLETAVFCTSLAAAPIDVGVEVLATGGTVSNSIAAGNGAVLNVAPGETVTFGTTGTVALLETSVITLPSITQGMARVVSTSPALLCSAISLDAGLAPPAPPAPPVAMSNLNGFGAGAPAAGATLPAPLPQFSDGKPGLHIATIPGVLKRGRLQTVFLCSSVASTPVDIGVEIFALDGTLLNDVHADVGVVLGVAPGATVSIATSTTAAYLESAVIPLSSGLQGVGRIVASSSQVRCTTVVVDDLASPPTALVTLGAAVQLGAGAVSGDGALPWLANGVQAPYAAFFPGTVKRGDVETDILCTSLASDPIAVGVQILAPDGSVANDVTAGSGVVLSVAPGSTVTFGTTGTAALFETKVITLPGIAQGMARVVSNSNEVLCSGLVLDAAVTPPATMTALAGYAATCGDGVIQPGEQCDGANAATCPGSCASDCLCPATCGDGVLQVGEVCDDHNTAPGDCCSASCQLECDDGSLCTQDSCNPSNGACTFSGAPSSSCAVAARNSLQLKQGITDSRNRLKWFWSGGAAIGQNDFGDPDTTAAYTLCIYDSNGGVDSLAASALLPPSSLWTNRAPRGWSYRDKLAAQAGFSSITLGAGIAGRTRILVKSAGASLPMPAPASASQFFAQQPNVTVQLRNNQTSACWESTFTTSTKNDGLQFKAKAP